MGSESKWEPQAEKGRESQQCADKSLFGVISSPQKLAPPAVPKDSNPRSVLQIEIENEPQARRFNYPAGPEHPVPDSPSILRSTILEYGLQHEM